MDHIESPRDSFLLCDASESTYSCNLQPPVSSYIGLAVVSARDGVPGDPRLSVQPIFRLSFKRVQDGRRSNETIEGWIYPPVRKLKPRVSRGIKLPLDMP